MKEKLILAVATCMLLSSASFAEGTVYEKPEITIVVNGEKIDATDVPIIVNSRTLIPLRNLLVSLGVPDNTENIKWIPETRSVEVDYDDVKIHLDIDSNVAYVNGKTKGLDSAPIIYNSRTYLPARFVGETLGYEVFWDAYAPAVIVTDSKKHESNVKILSEMNKALEKVSDYEAEFASRTLISVDNSDFEEESMKYVYEKVNFNDNLMEILTLHKENEGEGILEYYSDSARYYNKSYNNKFEKDDWQMTKYDSDFSEQTPFDLREKMIDFAFDDSLYGMFNVTDIGKYCVYNISKNDDILKSLAKSGLYFEKVDGEGELKDIQVMMFVNKETLLPESIQIETKREIINNEKYGADRLVTEQTSFYWKAHSYNKNVKISLPE